MENRKYAFSWGTVGDVDLGRSNLGTMVRLEAYRLIQGTFCEMLEEEYGTVRCEELYRKAGKRAGSLFYELCCGYVTTFEHFTESLAYAFRHMGIALIEVEMVGTGAWSFVVTLYEDMSCSGRNNSGDERCFYHEGFLAGIFEAYGHMEFEVRTVHNWTFIQRSCRFSVEAIIPTV